MKKNCFLFLSLITLVMLLNACSTDVDLYADYKDITVVYGLLDSDKDTNYVKINKAFLGPGNALEIAMIEDSCNYPYKLDAKIVEYRATSGGNNFQKTRELVLDTMTIHNKDTEGFFYAPDQLVYYTAERINNNTSQYKYRYELLIDRGDTILSAVTDMAGGDAFNINNGSMSFAGDNGTPVKWNPCPNASIYEIVMRFNYMDLRSPGDTTHDYIEWSLGTYPEASLELDHNLFVVSHKSEAFYTKLAEHLKGDTIGVDHLVANPAICISIAAGNEELYNFISVNGPSSSIVQSIPEYTNVKGGYGVFASRTMKEKMVRFTSITDITKWGFREIK